VRIYLTTDVFNAMRNQVITPAAVTIDTNYDALTSLAKNDTDLAAKLADTDHELSYKNALDIIRLAFLGQVDGVQGALMDLALDRLMARLTGPGWNPNDPAPLMTDFTLEAWVRVQSTGAIFSGTGGNHCSAWRLVLNGDGALEVWIDGFPFRRAASLPSDLPLTAWMDQWHHVAVVSAGKTWVFVDGAPKGYAEVVVGGPAFVGVAAGSGPPPITADFNEVRYWFRNLYQAEINGNLHAPIVAGNALGCVYGLEEGRFDDRLGGRSMQPSGTWSWSVLRPYGDGWIQAR
jgi:hypothetical protein